MHSFFSYGRLSGIIILTWLSANNAVAQFYESGTAPSSVRWQQIHTNNFRIIFPVDAASDGQRAANVLEYIHKAGGSSLNHYPAKIPIVLHNRTSFSNGFVSWAPKRSEMFLTPPQSAYANDWLTHLAIHEYRHVVQIDKLNQGFTRAMGFVVGQQAVGAVSGLLPPWFLEGDAVVTETALTNTGRGRDPAFEMPLRTIALSQNFQKYDKALFGSYRDHVPNHYEFGYQMIAWTRERYGEKTFEGAVDFVARNPYSFFLFPFKLGLQKQTGYKTENLYQNAFADLTNRWHIQETQTGYDYITPITKRTSNLYTDYRSPQYLNDNSFVTIKTGMAQIAQLVRVYSDGREQKLHTPGIINSERISYSNGLLAWTEHVQDVRWSNRTYSIVKLYDLNAGRERTLQRRSRFFAPAVSPDGSTVAVVEVTLEGASSIVILDVATGYESARLPNITEAFLQTPAWTKDGKSLLTIVNDGKSKSIVRIDVATGLYTTVLAPVYNDISHPVDGGKYAFFNSYFNGITNIYAVDYLTGAIMQVTSARFGAFDPQPNETGDKLVYVEYSVNGYDIVEIDIDHAKWTPIEQLRDNSLKLYRTLAQQDDFNIHDSIIPDRQYITKPYRKWANLLNVHSWAPLYYEVDVHNAAEIEFFPGAVLLSQDLLGNLTSSAGFSWRHGHGVVHAKFTYKGLYPMFDFSIDYGGTALISSAPEGGDYSYNPPSRNTNIYLRSYVPFTLTRSRWITGITPHIALIYDNRYMYSQKINDYQTGFYRLSYGVVTHRYLKTSLRDLAPRLGFLAQAAFLHSPWNKDQFGDIYYLYGRVFLPGVAPHHSLRLTGGWQHQKIKTYMSLSLLPFPRGYLRVFSEKLTFINFDYSLPLFYPDWNLSFLIYLKRLQANMFCDIARNRLADRKNDLHSIGIDLLADVNLMRIHFPFNIGIRTAYLPESREIKPLLLFSVNFY